MNHSGYCSGAYGDNRIHSFTQHLDWRNEWDEIPCEQKKEIVDWLTDGDIIRDNLYEISSLTSRDNPVVRYLVKEKKIPEPDVEGYAQRAQEEMEAKIVDMGKDKTFVRDEWDGIVITEYKDAKPFVDAFMGYKKEGYKLRKILYAKKLQMGFAIDELREHHMIRLASLNPVWRPNQEKTFEDGQRMEMKKDPRKSDDHVEKMFHTTRKHPWGDNWAGLLVLNTSKMSTILGGSQHAVPAPRYRYRIRWVNLKTREPREMTYESADISKMIDEDHIIDTDGYDKAPSIYPRNSYPEYATGAIWGTHKRVNLDEALKEHREDH